jgi:hypothetical protein
MNGNGPITIMDDTRPVVRCLFHYRDELQVYASKLRNQGAKEHIAFGLRFGQKLLGKEIASYDNMVNDTGVVSGLEFRNLWMAFRPGILLYQRVQDIDVITRLRDMDKRKLQDGRECWSLILEMLGCDGKSLGYGSDVIVILPYEGYKPLVDLEIFPLDHQQDKKMVSLKVLERGKNFISLLGIHHCTYEGIAKIQSTWDNGFNLSMVSIPPRKPTWSLTWYTRFETE